MMNTVSEILSKRKQEAYKNKLALGDMVDYSFHEAIDMCHWLGLRVRQVGAEWYISASVIDGRYAIRKDNGNEYYTLPEDILSRWEIVK